VRTIKNTCVLRILISILALFCMVHHAPGASAQEDEAPEGGGKKEAIDIKPDPKVVRCAVIGGMTMTKLWPEITTRFEAKTGYKTVVVRTGPRDMIAKPFREGRADLLTMHSGDITTDLVCDGYGTNMRPWTRNDLVIYGPPEDPAKIRGMKDGVEALRMIAQSQSPFLDGNDIGSREMCHNLWKKAGIKPSGKWYLQDDSPRSRLIPRYAAKKKAYVIMGRMPYLFKKIDFADLQIMVEGDPIMRRPYVVMEANPQRFPDTNSKGARALADFLLSSDIQNLLKEFGAREYGGIPLFYPVWPAGS
jgi:tungstate transport system substrate-binding protein